LNGAGGGAESFESTEDDTTWIKVQRGAYVCVPALQE
jgi:hypothetical protein